MSNTYDGSLPADGSPAVALELRDNFEAVATNHVTVSTDITNPAIGMTQYLTGDDLLRIVSGIGPAVYNTLIEDITGTPYVGYWRDPVANFGSLPGGPSVDWEIHAIQNVGGNAILYINDPNSPQTWRVLAPGPGVAMLYDSANDEYDVDVGLGGGQIPQLDSAGRLPAVDGSALINNVTSIIDDAFSPTVSATNAVALMAGVGISVIFGSLNDITIAVDPGATVISLDKFGTGSPDFTGAVFLAEDAIMSVCIEEEPSNNALSFTSRCSPLDPTWIAANNPSCPISAIETQLYNWAQSIFSQVGIVAPTVITDCDIFRAILIKLNSIQVGLESTFVAPSWEDKGPMVTPPNPFEPTSPTRPPPLLPPGPIPPIIGNPLPSDAIIPDGTTMFETDLNRFVRWDSALSAWFDDVHRFNIFEKTVLRNSVPITSVNFEGAVVIVETAPGILTITYDLQQFAHGAAHTFDGTDPLNGVYSFGGTIQPVFELGFDAVPGNRTIQATVQAITTEPGLRYNQVDCRWEARVEDGAYGPIPIGPASIPSAKTGSYFMQISLPEGSTIAAGQSVLGEVGTSGIPLALGGDLTFIHFTAPDNTHGGLILDIANETTPLTVTATFAPSTEFATVAPASPLPFIATNQLSVAINSVTSPFAEFYQIVLEFSY